MDGSHESNRPLQHPSYPSRASDLPASEDRSPRPHRGSYIPHREGCARLPSLAQDRGLQAPRGNMIYDTSTLTPAGTGDSFLDYQLYNGLDCCLTFEIHERLSELCGE